MFNKKPFREGDPVLLVTGSRHNGVRSYRPSTVSKVLKNGNFRVEAYPKIQYRQSGHAAGERGGFWDTRPVVHHDTDELRNEIRAERKIHDAVRKTRRLGRLLEKMTEEEALATWPKLPQSLKNMVKDA